MSAGFNQITILGRLGNDPTTRDTRTETTVTHFDVAVDESYKNRAGEKIEKVTWFRCEAWNGRGKAIGQYIGKGNRILINGRMEFRSYDRVVEINGEQGTIKFPDPILVVEDFKIIDWKEEGDGFDQGDF
ncbi:MAG: single-stranded DNA-binding protein [Cyanobacteria bacterium]|nr:single-stranded DNA-binding protein [Cyanobacteriota bacterium]